MACGENPKRVYGAKGRMPSTRMGNFAVDRATWAKAVAYKKKLDSGKTVDRDLAMETLAGVLSGDILVHNHCYRADEMALVIDMAHEFGYKVTRSEEHTSELQSLMRISYAVFCLKKKKTKIIQLPYK